MALWRTEDKVAAAMRRAIPMLPADAGHLVSSLLEPANIVIVTGTLVAWAGSHLFGIGEIVDVILLVVGFALLGFTAVDAGRALYEFASGATAAQTEADLDRAARAFSQAVTLLGVAVVSAVLLRSSARPVAARGKPRFRGLPDIGQPPPRGTPLKITRPRTLPSGALGETDWWGNIAVTRNQSFTEQRITLYHEWVHRMLAPRTGPLLKLRAQLRVSGYWRSALLQYLEEALAEAYAQLRVYGLAEAVTAVRFPIDGGYVVISQLTTEGLAIGNIAVGGLLLQVAVLDGYWLLENSR